MNVHDLMYIFSRCLYKSISMDAIPHQGTSSCRVPAIFENVPCVAAFSPVCFVIEYSRSTCPVRFTPSGVTSKAQAKTMARGNPINTRIMTNCDDQFGKLNIGKTVVVTCIMIHPATIYTAATLNIFRLLSSRRYCLRSMLHLWSNLLNSTNINDTVKYQSILILF